MDPTQSRHDKPRNHPDAVVGRSQACRRPRRTRSQAILEVLRHGERFLVCSHSRPDGDAVGSMLAMGMLLEQLGKQADLVTADRVPHIYRGLPGAEAIRTALRVHGPYDAAILLECDGLERTGCAAWSSSSRSTSITMPPVATLPI